MSTNSSARVDLRVCVLVIAVVIAGIAGACRTQAAARFPHRTHLAGLACGAPGQPSCLTCNSCHTPSETDRVDKLPDVALCDHCHHDDTATMKTVLAAQPERPYGAIAFDHDRHLGMPSIQGQCVSCHAGVVKADAPSIPPMRQCFSCHEHQEQWNLGECAPCHRARDLERTFPQSFMRHEGSFARRHGQAAALEPQLCRACHAQADCTECHDLTQHFSVEQRHPASIERALVHRGDFMVRHSIEAQSQPASCVRCHEPATCDGCHVERGVSGNLANGRNPHPPGWIDSGAPGGSFHAREARRDILLCAGCHEQGPATNCIRCHQVGAYGGNPHPKGWKGSFSAGGEMCRYCHG